MPHAVYRGDFILCPWPGCNLRMELIDFQLELGDPALYALVVGHWGIQTDYGLVGRCPGCDHFVRYGLVDKRAVDPAATSLPILPDDWHQHAYIEVDLAGRRFSHKLSKKLLVQDSP
jgi:hypothetical protein